MEADLIAFNWTLNNEPQTRIIWSIHSILLPFLLFWLVFGRIPLQKTKMGWILLITMLVFHYFWGVGCWNWSLIYCWRCFLTGLIMVEIEMTVLTLLELRQPRQFTVHLSTGFSPPFLLSITLIVCMCVCVFQWEHVWIPILEIVCAYFYVYRTFVYIVCVCVWILWSVYMVSILVSVSEYLLNYILCV